LRKALEAAAAAYRTADPGTTIVLSTDSSAALRTKIEEGAPADVFLSADMTNAQQLVDGGLAAGGVTPFAGNELTVIVPPDNPAAIATPADLGGAGVKVIAALDGVPIQRYTAEWLERVGALPVYGADFPDRYAANVASREDNASAIVTKVALGEGDAGVVYVTDAASSPDVQTIAIPAEENVPATYGGVVVGASPNQAAAEAFLDWLAGAEGQAVLASFGFLPPGP
jgi:molybdate transport system substrate-binding protein